ncbi:MAG: hypothetical protein KIH69_000095 [Anaerolineae bacterium]|nr:hypothetical protein [Anaerolineae bacterium]
MKIFQDDVFEVTLSVAAVTSDVKVIICQLLGNNCTVGKWGTNDIYLQTRVASGFGGLNPTMLTIWLQQQPPAATQISIQGRAKESLIKQRAAQHAVQQLATRLLAVNWA